MSRSREITNLRVLEGKTIGRVTTMTGSVLIVFTDGTGVSFQHEVFIDTEYTYDAGFTTKSLTDAEVEAFGPKDPTA